MPRQSKKKVSHFHFLPTQQEQIDKDRDTLYVLQTVFAPGSKKVYSTKPGKFGKSFGKIFGI